MKRSDCGVDVHKPNPPSLFCRECSTAYNDCKASGFAFAPLSVFTAPYSGCAPKTSAENPWLISCSVQRCGKPSRYVDKPCASTSGVYDAAMLRLAKAS